MNQNTILTGLLALFMSSNLAGAAPAVSPAGKSSSGPPASIVAFGDSITRGYGVPEGKGWVELLSKQIQKEGVGKTIPVFNAGGNGNTSAEGLKRFETDVLSHLPGLVFVGFSANDSVHDSRAVSVEQFKLNLIKIIEGVQGRGGDVVLMTTPPVISEWHQTRADSYYAPFHGLDHYLDGYRKAVRDLAKLKALPLVDLDHLLRELILKKGKAAFIKPDGIHLTEEANQIVADAVFKSLKDQGRLLH